MQTVEHVVEVSTEMQQKLERLRHAYSLPDTTAVLELLISTQIDRTVYQMTGIKQGPRLAIDNTRTDHRQPTITTTTTNGTRP